MQKKIAHITDTHLGDKTALDRGINPKKNLKGVLETIAANAVDELVFTGDLGEENNYEWFFKTLDKYKPGFKIVLGNHDNYGEASKYFKNYKTVGEGELYYSYEDEMCKYIFMDSSSSFISPAQLKWLKDEMATTRRIVVFIHHPVIGIPTGVDTAYPLHNRDEVAAILQQSKSVVNVFCGHYHMPDNRQQGKINQYVTPAVSFQVKKFSPTIEIESGTFGFRIITITETAIKSRLIINNYDGFIPEKF
jgi:Icc protein